MDGVIVVDKPAGWTSHDVVAKMRRLAGIRRVGHLGTLDPAATGVLPLIVGKATRLAQFYSSSDKLYEGVVRFGYSTATYDGEGEPRGPERNVTLTREEARDLFASFQGKIEQVPPPVSAKKIGGVPAYKLARQNKPVELKPVQVQIYSLEILDCRGPEVGVRVHCSAGTYLRSIAHEAGRLHGAGAFLLRLRRLAAGDFTIEQARTLEELAGLAAESRLQEALVPAASLLPQFPAETVDAITAGQIRQGRDFRVSPFRVRGGCRYVKAVSREGDLLAIGEARLPNLYHPILVF